MTPEMTRILNNIDFENIDKHPNILIAARIWDDDRYHAARVCYKFMRMIDDLIDNELSSLSEAQISAARRAEGLVELQLVQTEQALSLLFGQIEGEWYLLVVDAAIFDCSA